MEQAQKPGQIIILNGAPRSGKSSIVTHIQATFDGVWMNLGVDGFMQLTPKQYLPGMGLRPGGERQDIEPLVPVLYRALYESIAAHSRLGLNVVTDVGHHDGYAISRGILPDCAQRLKELPVLFVGIYCPIEVIMERRRNTGWNQDHPAGAPIPPPIHLWQREVHLPGIYDLELDTSLLTPQECAETIQQHLKSKPISSAVQRLAAMTPKQD